MNINRSNYEVWIIDWLDGNLSRDQEKQLKLFLHNNPDIREESEDLFSPGLKPENASFKNKDLLKKEPSELPEQQFEYLCAAYLEGDLSPEQIGELRMITANDPVAKKTFDLIQNTKLAPPADSYKNKKSLIRLTPVQKFARTAIIGLSAAAAIILLITFYFTGPRPIKGKETTATKSNLQDTTVIFEIKKALPVIMDNPVRIDRAVAMASPVQKTNTSIIKPSDAIYKADRSSLIKGPARDIQINKIAIASDIDLSVTFPSSALVAYNAPAVISTDEEDADRSRLGKFIAKTFREKILREKTSSDAPLKAYEIAEAGVTGLNKLLGWEMALNEKKDANGEVSAIYFSSKVLKFNAPVKKSSPSM
jgi:hypothetical protein